MVYAFALSSLGAFLIVGGWNAPDYTVPLRLVSCSYLLALATYLYNDITDYKTDTINNRGTVHDLETARRKITKQLTAGFFVFSTVLAFSINIPTGIASLAFSGLAVLYSHPRTHLKSMFVVKTAVTGAGAFITSMMGCLSVGQLSYLGLLSSLIPFCFYFILGPLGDISDLKGDREEGRRTFPIVLGIKKSFGIIVAATFAISSIFLISGIFLGVSGVGVGLGISLTAFILAKVFHISRKYNDKKEMSGCRRSIRYCIFGCQISMLCGVLLVGVI